MKVSKSITLLLVLLTSAVFTSQSYASKRGCEVLQKNYTIDKRWWDSNKERLVNKCLREIMRARDAGENIKKASEKCESGKKKASLDKSFIKLKGCLCSQGITSWCRGLPPLR